MGWIKTKLDDTDHARLKHYRDQTNVDNLEEAVKAFIQQGLARYERENDELPTEYDKEDKPPWNQ